MKLFSFVAIKAYICRAIIVNMKKLVTSLLLTLLLTGCSTEHSEVDNTVNNGKIQVSIGQSLAIKSRTSIGEDGRSAEWSKGDKIALWAVGSEGNYALEAESFSLYRYESGYDNVVFTAFIDPMPADSYTYYAAYPIPVSVSGTSATYTLANEQDGSSFVGSADIMVSAAVTAPELAEGVVSKLDLRFTHKMHALRITLPGDGTLAGEAITAINFTFPAAVTGDVVVDVANPAAPATLTNGSNKLRVKIPNGYKAGDTVWAMIFPTELNGDIIYTVEASGYKSVERRVAISKSAESSHISPMSFAVPEIDYSTDIYIDVTENNLGEDYNTITIYDNSGTAIQRYSRNADHSYYVTTVKGQIDSSALAGTKYRVVFDSDNAVVESNISVGQITPYRPNSLATAVPYLLYEDFSTINTTYANKGDDDTSSGDDRKQPGESLNKYMASQGWSAARFMVSKGNCVRINVRYQMVKIFVLSFTTTHRGRLDTPQLSALKSGSTVKLKVSFDAGAHVAKGSSMDYTGQSCTSISVSTHTNSASAIDGVATGTGENGALTDFGTTHYSDFLIDGYAIDSWTSSFPTKSISVPNATSEQRLCFYADTSATLDGIGNEEFFVYIDNIKVSIDK